MKINKSAILLVFIFGIILFSGCSSTSNKIENSLGNSKEIVDCGSVDLTKKNLRSVEEMEQIQEIKCFLDNYETCNDSKLEFKYLMNGFDYYSLQKEGDNCFYTKEFKRPSIKTLDGLKIKCNFGEINREDFRNYFAIGPTNEEVFEYCEGSFVDLVKKQENDKNSENDNTVKRDNLEDKTDAGCEQESGDFFKAQCYKNLAVGTNDLSYCINVAKIDPYSTSECIIAVDSDKKIPLAELQAVCDSIISDVPKETCFNDLDEHRS